MRRHTFKRNPTGRDACFAGLSQRSGGVSCGRPAADPIHIPALTPAEQHAVLSAYAAGSTYDPPVIVRNYTTLRGLRASGSIDEQGRPTFRGLMLAGVDVDALHAEALDMFSAELLRDSRKIMTLLGVTEAGDVLPALRHLLATPTHSCSTCGRAARANGTDLCVDCERVSALSGQLAETRKTVAATGKEPWSLNAAVQPYQPAQRTCVRMDGDHATHGYARYGQGCYVRLGDTYDPPQAGTAAALADVADLRREVGRCINSGSMGPGYRAHLDRIEAALRERG